jgi:hypothetical protein
VLIGRDSPPALPDLEEEFLALHERVSPYTMTSIERMYALWQATRHVVTRGIDGAFVECGVWRGGSSLLMALTLLALNDRSRKLYLFDTFEGMPPPSAEDIAYTGEPAADVLAASDRTPGVRDNWAWATLEDVKRTLATAAYPSVNYVPGLVEDTIPGEAPDQIALLRLDTDWYESTRHELEHLYPRLASGGILIVDDYGHWRGARSAVDGYFAKDPVLLNRIDYTGRLIQKS